MFTLIVKIAKIIGIKTDYLITATALSIDRGEYASINTLITVRPWLRADMMSELWKSMAERCGYGVDEKDINILMVVKLGR